MTIVGRIFDAINGRSNHREYKDVHPMYRQGGDPNLSHLQGGEGPIIMPRWGGNDLKKLSTSIDRTKVTLTGPGIRRSGRGVEDGFHI